jgi:GT2 family glycosyltransferase
MKLSVIVVSFNVKGYLSLCISSALDAMKPLGEGESELIVVDNASSDDSVGWVQSNQPEVQVISLDKNLGFSAANNIGIRQAQGDWVLLLNPDTIVPEDTFVKIMNHVSQDAQIGGLGVPMYDGSGQWLPESKRGIPTPWASFCRLSGIWRLAPSSRVLNGYYFSHVGRHETADVEVLSGAFMWLRRAALDEVGLLDDAFFMYGEDIDLSMRVVEGGWVNRYYSQAPIVHFKGESTKKGSLSYVRVFHEAMRIFSEKHFAGGQAWAMRWMIRLGIRLRAVSTFIHGVVQRQRNFVLDGLAGALCTFGVLSAHSKWTGIEHPLQPRLVLIALGVVSIFLAGRWFGSADRPYHRLRTLRLGVVASVALLVLYSTMPETLRVSRLSSLISAVLIGFIPYFSRTALVLFRPSLHRWRKARPSVGISASGPQSQRIGNWVQESYGSALEVIGFGPDTVTEDAMMRCDLFLHGAESGGQSCLDAIVLGGSRGVDVRIVPRDLLLALGGLRRDGAPTAQLSWGADGLGRPDRMRMKRRLDVMWSLAMFVLGPGRGRYSKDFSRVNARSVLRGEATWLGFHKGWDGDDRLPALPKGILHTGTGHRESHPEVARRLDLRQAADFGWVRDLELLMNLRMD